MMVRAWWRKCWAGWQALLMVGATLVAAGATQALVVPPAASASTGNSLSCIYTPTDFANAFLSALQDPISSQNVEAIVGWEEAEGGNWLNTAHFNPLNTTEIFDNSQPYYPGAAANNGGYAVQSYLSWGDGLQATVITITNGYYPNILSALQAGTSAKAVANAVGNSPWGTGNFSADLPPNYDPTAPAWETPCGNVDTAGEAWVPVGATGTTDYCRPVGAGPNLVNSQLACTPYNGTSFGTTQQSSSSAPLDWGYDAGRAWVPIPGGKAAYCRRVGAGPNWVASYLACTPFDGTSFGPTVTSPVLDWGYTAGAQWVQTSSGADYCRLVGAGPNWVASYLACTPFDGTSFGPTVTTTTVVDWGYAGAASWVATANGPVYCRQVGAGPDLVASYVQCTTFAGSSFGSTVTSGVVDWGYPVADTWVPAGSGVAYCRRVGAGPNGVNSYLACTEFASLAPGSTPTTVISGLANWGYDPGATWAPGPGGVDYCAWSDASHLSCTSFNGSSFGYTNFGQVEPWGFDT